MSVGHDLELAKKNIAEFKPEIVCTRTFDEMLEEGYGVDLDELLGDE